MAVKVLELHHHGIRVGSRAEELSKALTFYRDVLGLQVAPPTILLPMLPGAPLSAKSWRISQSSRSVQCFSEARRRFSLVRKALSYRLGPTIGRWQFRHGLSGSDAMCDSHFLPAARPPGKPIRCCSGWSPMRAQRRGWSKAVSRIPASPIMASGTSGSCCASPGSPRISSRPSSKGGSHRS